MKRTITLIAYLFSLLFIFSITNCRSLTGQRETRKEKEIRYKQKKIDEEREKNGNFMISDA